MKTTRAYRKVLNIHSLVLQVFILDSFHHLPPVSIWINLSSQLLSMFPFLSSKNASFIIIALRAVKMNEIALSITYMHAIITPQSKCSLEKNPHKPDNLLRVTLANDGMLQPHANLLLIYEDPWLPLQAQRRTPELDGLCGPGDQDVGELPAHPGDGDVQPRPRPRHSPPTLLRPKERLCHGQHPEDAPLADRLPRRLPLHLQHRP